MANHTVGTIADGRAIAHKLEAMGWGLFFIWIGIALLANLGWGICLLGIGILILGTQIARKSMAQGFETFWVLVGLFFILGGAWMLLGIRVSLLPIFCILAGVGLLVSALIGKSNSPA